VHRHLFAVPRVRIRLLRCPGRIRTCDARFRKSCDCGLFRFYQVLQLRTGCTTGLHGHLWSTVRTTIRTTVPLAPPPCRGPRRAGASGACGPPALRLSRSAGVSPPFAALLTHPWASERVVWATRRSLPTFPAVTAGNDHGRGTTCAVGGYGLVCSGSRGPQSSGSRSMRVRACWWPMFDLGGDSVGAAGCAGGVVRVMTPGRVGGGGGRWIWARSRRASQGSPGFDDEDGEQPANLVAGQLDEPGGCGVVGMFVSRRPAFRSSCG
jgi:hypothetical protein